MTDYPFPPVPVERAETRPLRIVTRDPKGWRVTFLVTLGLIAVGIAGGTVLAVTAWS